jgi:hypothetical protein
MREAECREHTKAVEMKTGFLGIAPLEVERVTGFRKIFSGAGFRNLFHKIARDFPVRNRQAGFSLRRFESRDWIVLREEHLRLLQLDIRVILGALLLLPVVASFTLFCAAAICTDKLGRKNRQETQTHQRAAGRVKNVVAFSVSQRARLMGVTQSAPFVETSS